MLEINVTGNLDTALLEKARRVPGAVERALDVATGLVEQEAARQEGRIRQRRIPTSGRGKPLWQRTGNLAASRTRITSREKRVVLWRAKYARRRFGLGYDWQPKNPAGGIVRKNNVPADTARIVAPYVAAVVENELSNAIGD